MKFKDKAVLITGATRGIGFATARVFLQQGARIAVNGRTAKSVEAAMEKLDKPGRIIASPGDVGAVANCETVIMNTVEKLFPTEDPFGSAHRAANQSFFGVGICCSIKEIAVHHSNHPKETPLFHFPLDQCTRKRARLLGANAARLIKVAPFETP